MREGGRWSACRTANLKLSMLTGFTNPVGTFNAALTDYPLAPRALERVILGGAFIIISAQHQKRTLLTICGNSLESGAPERSPLRSTSVEATLMPSFSGRPCRDAVTDLLTKSAVKRLYRN